MRVLRKILILSFYLVVLAGCGEAYRGQVHFDASDSESETEFFNREDRRVSQTEPHADHKIFMAYFPEMDGDVDDIEELHESIEAFDLIVRQRDNNTAQLSARVAFGCNRA